MYSLLKNAISNSYYRTLHDRMTVHNELEKGVIQSVMPYSQ